MSAPPDPGSVFVDHRRQLRQWKPVVAGLAVLALVLGLVYVGRDVASGPDAAVRAYFGALAERDPAAALRRIAPEVAGPAPRDLLTPEVLGSPDYQPPQEVEVTTATIDGREAVVDVAYTVGGRVRQASLRLRRDGGFVDSILPRWLVVDGLGAILIESAPDEITVNGQRVAAYDSLGPRVLSALPGAYQVGVPAGDPIWEERVNRVEVVPQRGADLAVPMVARPEVREEVDRQIARLLDGCAARAEAIPPNCPFGYGRLLRVDDVRWQITRYPHVRLSAGREPAGPVLRVESARDGEAVITGTTSFGSPLEATVPFPVSGTATVRGTTVLFRPDW